MKSAASLDRALDGALRPVARRLRIARIIRGGALGLGAGAVITATGAPLAAGLALGALGAAIGGLWPSDPRQAVQRLDAAAGLDGALRCAWDHQGDDQPLARAQRKQALEALEAARAAGGRRGPDTRAAPRPAAGWLLGPALWILPLLMPPDLPDPGVAAAGGAAGEPIAAGGVLPAQPVEPATPAPTVSPIGGDEARAHADPPEPDAGDGADASPDRDAGAAPERSDGGVGDPQLTARGAAGQQAGERGGGLAGAAPVEARVGEGPALILPAAAGAFARGAGPTGRLVVGRSPPPPDAIADPARPYPSRYRQAIAAWFDRSAP